MSCKTGTMLLPDLSASESILKQEDHFQSFSNLMNKSEFIKDELRAAGISQAYLAESLGVTRQCVNAALNGECVTRVWTAVSILFGRPVSELFRPKGKPGRNKLKITAQ